MGPVAEVVGLVRRSPIPSLSGGPKCWVVWSLTGAVGLMGEECTLEFTGACVQRMESQSQWSADEVTGLWTEWLSECCLRLVWLVVSPGSYSQLSPLR